MMSVGEGGSGLMSPLCPPSFPSLFDYMYSPEQVRQYLQHPPAYSPGWTFVLYDVFAFVLVLSIALVLVSFLLQAIGAPAARVDRLRAFSGKAGILSVYCVGVYAVNRAVMHIATAPGCWESWIYFILVLLMVVPFAWWSIPVLREHLPGDGK